MIPKKSLAFSIASAITIWTFSHAYAGQKEVLLDKIAVVVEGEPILLSDLERAKAPFMKSLEQIKDPEAKAEKEEELTELVLDKLIDEKLLEQQIKKLGIKIEDREVELAVNDILKRNRLDRDKLKQLLEQQGQTLEEYEEQVRKQLARLKLINIKIKSRVEVSEEDIDDYISRNLSKGQEEEVHARHILLSLPQDAPEEEVEKVMEKARDIAKLARAGHDFAELAEKYSQGPSASKGGDLGFFRRGQMVKPFEDVAFSLKPGEISDPVRTKYGIHIVQVLERRKIAGIGQPKRDKIKQRLVQEKVDQRLKAWLDELKKKVQIEYKL